MPDKSADESSQRGRGRSRSSQGQGAVATFKLTPPLEGEGGDELDKVAGEDIVTDPGRGGSGAAGGRSHRRRSQSFAKEDDLVSETGSDVGSEHRRRRDADDSQSFFASPEELTERVRAMAPTLSSIPELSLDEASHVRQCFAELMGERENITNTLELRVLLGNLGFYPPERELELLLKAYRCRVNLSGLIRFLRFYKKNYPTYEGPDRSRYRILLQHNGGSGNGGDAGDGDVFSQLSAPPPGMRDEDAIRAFIALGGEEDGSGVVEIDRLQNALQEFGVTVDFSEEMIEKDRGIGFADFCGLWDHRPHSAEDHRFGMPGLFPLRTAALDENSVSSFSQLNPQTPGPPSLLLSRRISHLPRRLLSMLEGAVAGGGSLSPNFHGRPSQQLRVSLRGGGGGKRPLPQHTGLHHHGGPGYLAGQAVDASKNSTISGGGGGNYSHGKDSEGASEVDSTYPSGYGRQYAAQGVVKSGSFSGGRDDAPLQQQQTPQQRLLSEPISYEEHAQLLCLYLFPERYEGGGGGGGGGGRRARFALQEKISSSSKSHHQYIPSGGGGGVNPSGGAGGGSGGTAGGGGPGAIGGGGAAAAGGGGAAAAGVPFRRDGSSYRFGAGAGGSRSLRRNRSKGKKPPILGWKTSTYGQKKEEESDEDDFFSQRNGGAYRPPSPTILSLRHSTAYKRYQRNQQQQQKQQQQKLLSEKDTMEKKKKDKTGPGGGEGHFSSTGTSGSNDVAYGAN